MLKALGFMLGVAVITPALAQECDWRRAESLAQLQTVSYNAYYFAPEQNVDRCRSLMAAIEYQKELVTTLRVCRSAEVIDAVRRLSFLSGLPSGDDACRP